MKNGMKVLVGIDGSDHSLWALMEAINISKRFSGFLKTITVYNQGKDEEARKIRKKTLHYLEREKISGDFAAILGSNPSRALVDTARNENFDLIVVGSRGLGSAASILLGSISKKVATDAHCDVLIIKK